MCGMTREDDVQRAVELGVDAIGFVLWPNSPRAVGASRLESLVRTIPTSIAAVGVFVDPSEADIDRAIDAGVRIVQIHGRQAARERQVAAREGRGTATWIARSLETDVTDVPSDLTLLLDAHDLERHGGTGRTIDWTRAATVAAQRRVVLAGGLTPANVTEAIRQVRPYGVDVASGIEDQPGVKNAQAMKAFVAAVREADQ